MEWVVPAIARRNHAQRFVDHRVSFIRHQQVRRSTARKQSLFAMLDSPLELLDRDQNLTETGIDLGLSAVEAASSNNFVLMTVDVM